MQPAKTRMIEFSYIVSITDILATVIDNLEKQKISITLKSLINKQTRIYKHEDGGKKLYFYQVN